MKKTILIMLLVLPVVIVTLAYILAGVVWRNAQVPPITGVTITDTALMNDHGVFFSSEVILIAGGFHEGQQRVIQWQVGQVIPLGDFLAPAPRHPQLTLSNLDLSIEFTNQELDYGAITLTEEGVVTVVRVLAGTAYITISHSEAVFLTIEIVNILS